MRLLVTGGCGFVGSSLAIQFKRENPDYKIVAFDNLKRRGSELNIARLRKEGIDFVHGDIRNREDLWAAGDFDVMLECSAEPSVLAGYDGSPDYVLNTNLFGTINCLELVRKKNASIIFLSTSRVYPIDLISQQPFTESETRFEISEQASCPGISARGISEDFPIYSARSLYGATKLASELLLLEYFQMYGVRGVINRCGVLTGPWQMGKVDQGVVVLWVARHHFRQQLSYIGYGGSGKQVRDILHINDLFRLIRQQVENIDLFNGKTLNVGGGRDISISLLELTSLCEKATGNSIPIIRHNEDRKGDIPWYITDCSRVRELCGWQPVIKPEEIVTEIAEWIRDNQTALEPILA